MRRVLGGLQSLQESDPRVDRSIHAPIPLFDAIQQAEFDRVHANFFANLIDHRLTSEGCVRSAWRTIGGRARLVHQNIITVHQGILDLVRGKHHAHASPHRRARICTRLVCQHRLDRGNSALRVYPHLGFDVRARGRSCCRKHVATAHRHFDRAVSTLARE